MPSYQVSITNNVKIYNLSVGRSLPDWISDRRKRKLVKEDEEIRSRIELIEVKVKDSSCSVSP